MCVADLLLTFTNVFIICVGSMAFFDCLRKRAKSAAKLARSMDKTKKKKKKKAPGKASKVHPL